MEAPFASGLAVDGLLDPDGQPWAGAGGDSVALIGTPAGMQPTAAIRNSWTNKRIGAVERVRVAAVHNGEFLAFRLEWEDATQDDALGDTIAFPDAAAVAFPAVAGAPAVTMGAPGAAVNAWYWRADENGRGREVVAEGLGTSRAVSAEGVRAQGVWKEGRWRVVIARALRVQTSEPVVQLEPGTATGYAVAVWEGSHRERAGIKAFSGDWRELRLAPATLARR